MYGNPYAPSMPSAYGYGAQNGFYNQSPNYATTQFNQAQTPAAMQAVWDWEHEQMIDKVTGIKVLLATYRGS